MKIERLGDIYDCEQVLGYCQVFQGVGLLVIRISSRTFKRLLSDSYPHTATLKKSVIAKS